MDVERLLEKIHTVNPSETPSIHRIRGQYNRQQLGSLEMNEFTKLFAGDGAVEFKVREHDLDFPAFTAPSIQGFLRIARGDDFEACVLEHHGDCPQDRGFVVHD